MIARDASAVAGRCGRGSAGRGLIELPGFESRLGAAAFLGLALPLGLLLGRRRAVYVSLELASQAIVAVTCPTISRRPYVGFNFSSGRAVRSSTSAASRLWPLRRALLRRARYLVAQTPAAAAELEAVIGEERLAVVPTPVGRVAAPPLSGEPRVLFTGRLTGQKGLEGLVEAWPAVLERIPAARLDDRRQRRGRRGSLWPPVEEELKSARRGRAGAARDGHLQRLDRRRRRLLAGHDVYVLPSRSEGMSNALLEAGAWDRVIAASDLAANRAVLGEGYPLLFGVDDAAAIAARLTPR